MLNLGIIFKIIKVLREAKLYEINKQLKCKDDISKTSWAFIKVHFKYQNSSLYFCTCKMENHFQICFDVAQIFNEYFVNVTTAGWKQKTNDDVTRNCSSTVLIFAIVEELIKGSKAKKKKSTDLQCVNLAY